MNIKKFISNGNPVIKVSGKLDITNSSEFRAIIDELEPNNCRNLSIDFTELQYISSSGIRQLLRLNLKLDYKITIYISSETIKDFFSITGLDLIFNIIEK